ncbi:MAG: NAD(P)/FAD-dependent oxidoreductase [Cyanobacteriota bacterium]
MKHYDWIVVGGGITGAALAYELAKKDFSILLLEKDAKPDNATRYSYGGLAYWSGTSPITRQLCQEGISLHRCLSDELDADTEFRELDLLLTILPNDDQKALLENYQRFAISPQFLQAEEAVEREPLLNKNAIAGAIRFPHGHIHTQKTTEGYLNAFQRLGGEIQIVPVLKLLRNGNSIQGVITPQQTYYAANTVICAGGLSRSLLQESGIPNNVYFTHAEVIETRPIDLKLSTLIMPANTKRFALEANATQPELNPLWDIPGNEPLPAILDPGAIQFLDGHLCLGQLSRVLSDPYAKVNAAQSEAAIRTAIGKILPSLEHLPGTWHSCLVAFSRNFLPLVGAINDVKGVYLFSGFTNTLLFAPPLAKHFVNWVAGEKDEIIMKLNRR